MLINIFAKVLNMSLTASFVIAVVLLARLLLRRSPKIFSYALWSVVLLRLLCPASFPSAVSLIPSGFHDAVSGAQWEEPGVAEDLQNDKSWYDTSVPDATADFPIIDQSAIHPHEEKEIKMPAVLCAAWSLGVAVIWLYSVFSYVRLRGKLSDAVPLRDNIYLSDHIPSPCVAGLLRQRIYLPSIIGAGEQPYIIAHEQHHIRRGDPFTRFLAFTALTIHWFNPLVWLSFHLLVKDMEMSCDEAVLRKLGPEIRSDYSQSLLNLAAGHPRVAWTPLTFGETETGGRIKNILRWRKPAAWTVALAMLLSVTVSVCALTDPIADMPAAPQTKENEPSHTPEIMGDIPYIKLNDTQKRVLQAYLYSDVLEEMVSYPQKEIRILFGAEVFPYTLFYGYWGGNTCLIVTQNKEDISYITTDENLIGYLYHFYICNGSIDMDFTELPEDAVLRSSNHAECCDVRIYSYHCTFCDQEETAIVSYYCGCGNCTKFWRDEAAEIHEHTDGRR